MESAHHYSSEPDCNSTAEVPSLILRTAPSAMQLSRNGEALMYIGSKMTLHTLTDYTKNLENDNSGLCHSGSISNGTNHRVLPPVGGNGVVPGGVHNNSRKVDKWGCMQSDMIERENLLCLVFSHNLKRVDFQDFFRFVAVGSLTADSSLLQPTGVWTPPPHTSIFAMWTSARNSRTSWKWISLVHWQLVNCDLGAQNGKPNNVWSDLKHLGICERSSDANRHEGIMHWSSLFRWHHTALAQVWVRTHARVIPSSWFMRLVCFSDCFDISIHFWSPCSSFCPSTSSSRMWWTNPLCNSAEDLGTLAPRTSLPHIQDVVKTGLGHGALVVQRTLCQDGLWPMSFARWSPITVKFVEVLAHREANACCWITEVQSFHGDTIHGSDKPKAQTRVGCCGEPRESVDGRV